MEQLAEAINALTAAVRTGVWGIMVMLAVHAWLGVMSRRSR